MSNGLSDAALDISKGLSEGLLAFLRELSERLLTSVWDSLGGS